MLTNYICIGTHQCPHVNKFIIVMINRSQVIASHHMAAELRCNHLTSVYHDDNEFIHMRALVSAYTDVVCEHVRVKNRYKALFRSEALPTKGIKIYSEPERIKELSRPVDHFIAENLMEQ